MSEIVIDDNLTTENCEEKGYQWHQDGIYDPDGPEDADKEFVELIKRGWKLGKPALKELEKNGGVGIYKPSESSNIAEEDSM